MTMTILIVGDIKMRKGLISIIMPVYNAEKYLTDTINSVLNQTYKDFELIAVNDGSTDQSLNILSRFNDERIIVIDKENTGVSDTRNVGINVANGEYVCFLDADDSYSPEYLERLFATSVENEADMVVCNYVPFRREAKFQVEKSVPVNVQSIDTLVQAGVLTSACTKLIKLLTLYKYEIKFDKNMSFGEDLFFCWKAYLASNRVFFIDEPLYGYRMTTESATTKYHPDLYDKYKKAFDDLKQFGKSVDKNDEYEMDVFFATRIPSFIRMLIREKSSFKKKKNDLKRILNDDTIIAVYRNWEFFKTHIHQKDEKFYRGCKCNNVCALLLSGYVNETISFCKKLLKRLYE